jgi:arylamine N-acetyltransferase
MDVVHIEVDWRYVSAVLLIIFFAILAFLRDRWKIVYRVEEVERQAASCKEDRELLDTRIHSDVDKILMIATAAQEAARMQGKDFDVRDFAMILRHRQKKKQMEKERERTGQPPAATS